MPGGKNGARRDTRRTKSWGEEFIMSEIARIQDELQRSYDGEPWPGPSLSGLLGDVSAEKAAAKPIATAHSIWEFVLHVAAWQKIVVRRLAGETVVTVPEEENFPPVTDKSHAAWNKALKALNGAHQDLYDAIG